MTTAGPSIRNLDDERVGCLRPRAVRHGRSPESDVRQILRLAVEADPRLRDPVDAAGLSLHVINLAQVDGLRQRLCRLEKAA